jgi:hypothetical protein
MGYLLGVKNGQIAIWKDNDPQPARVFPWSMVLLPGPIQEALEKGIYVEADSDIGRLIADMIP